MNISSCHLAYNTKDEGDFRSPKIPYLTEWEIVDPERLSDLSKQSTKNRLKSRLFDSTYNTISMDTKPKTIQNLLRIFLELCCNAIHKSSCFRTEECYKKVLEFPLQTLPIALERTMLSLILM